MTRLTFWAWKSYFSVDLFDSLRNLEVNGNKPNVKFEWTVKHSGFFEKISSLGDFILN